MKLETFFNRFEDLADTPNAVSKMRELILQLAAHGKLVEQSSGDEPASALVSRIEKHIEGLRSRKLFRGSPVEPLNRDELPDVPSSWEWVRLGNVVDYGSSNKAESAEIPDDAWLLDLEDIEKDTSRLLQRKSFRDSPSKSTKTAFAVGDVLYGKLRPYLNKVIVADAPGFCTTEIIPIRAFGFIDPVYLCHALKRPEFIAYAISKSYGMNLPRLGTEDARSAPFPLPPLAEQKRIVAKVDELMSLCDRLEAQQQERETQHAALARASLSRFADAPTPANLDFLFHKSYDISPADLRKTILNLAVQGKLVPQDPNDEPAASLLAQITRKKKAMIEAKTVRQGKVSRPHSALDAPTELPVGWEWVNVDSLCFKVTDGTHFTPQYAASGVRFVSAKDIVSGRLVFDRCKFITQEEHEQLYRRCNPEYHDIVISKSGSIGTVALVEDRDEFSLFESLALLKFDQTSLFSRFLVCALTQACSSLTTGHIRGVGVKHLHLDILRGLELALPPLAEQRRIVAKVEQLMALVDALETQLAASRATAAKLLEALVAELTSGKEAPPESKPVKSADKRKRRQPV
jgi:type I restriction enzyme S subunit